MVHLQKIDPSTEKPMLDENNEPIIIKRPRSQWSKMCKFEGIKKMFVDVTPSRQARVEAKNETPKPEPKETSEGLMELGDYMDQHHLKRKSYVSSQTDLEHLNDLLEVETANSVKAAIENRINELKS